MTNFKLVFIVMFAIAVNVFAVDENNSGNINSENFRKVGAAGGLFMKIGFGGRSTAMGGASAAVTDDIYSIHWNPAGLAEYKKLGAAFSYTSWFADFSHNFAAVTFPLGGNYILAAHVLNFSSGDIPVTTLNQPEGTGSYYSVNDLSFGLSLAGYLTEQFTFGVTAKFVRQAFTSLSATGFAFDIGSKYDTGLEGLKLGFSLHNLGTEQRFSGQDLSSVKKLFEGLDQAPLDASLFSYPFSLPITFRAGATMDLMKDETNKLTVAADFITQTDTPEQFALGAEYGFQDFFFIRAGYNGGHDQFGLAGGIGVKYFSGDFTGVFDYSINPTADLGLINRFSVALSFE